MINELLMEGVISDEDYLDILSEGEQADAYRARKEKEKRDRESNDRKSIAHRNINNIGYKTPRYDSITGERTNSNFMASYKNEDKHKMDKDIETNERASDRFNKDMDRRDRDSSGKSRKIETDGEGYMTDRSHVDFTRAADSMLRHERRHPSKESYDFMEDIDLFDM